MPVLAWKCLYPVGIHFVLSQLVSYLGLYFLVQRTGADMSAYYQHVLMLTGLTGILAAVPCILLYRGDFSRRKETGILYPAADRHLPVPEILGFLIIGAFQSGSLSGNSVLDFRGEKYLESDFLDGDCSTFCRRGYFPLAGISSYER